MFADLRLSTLGQFTPEFPDAETLHLGLAKWDPLFAWLEADADLSQMKWFLTQEAAGETGFDDLVAMTQVKLPIRPKLELARNCWDEMGRGSEPGMYGPMLDRTVAGPAPDDRRHAVAVAVPRDTMAALATTRRYTYQSIGALGAVELTAPTRVSAVAEGLKRLGVAAEQRKYFILHANFAVEHSRAWNTEAIAPLVADTPDCARHVAEGAVMRLICGEQCFETYRTHLWAHAHAVVYAAE